MVGQLTRQEFAVGKHLGNGETILVVEDDIAVRRVIIRILTDLGYKVVEASDGNAALKVLNQTPDISLLFTDVVLPNGMNAGELAREAKQRRPDLKVLYTTGYADDFVARHGHYDEGINLLRKPYLMSSLARIVREALDRRE